MRGLARTPANISMGIKYESLSIQNEELCLRIKNCIGKPVLLRRGLLLGFKQKTGPLGGDSGRKDAPSASY